MSGDGKDAGQETADEVHPPCPPVEPKTEELHREDDRGTLAQEICSSAAMSGDGKDAGQETADEVHPPIPCPPVEPKAEELDREDERGTELHGHGSPEKVPQAHSIKRGKKKRLSSLSPPRKNRSRSADKSMVESSHNQDSPPTPDADGHPRSDAARPYPEMAQDFDFCAFESISDEEGSLRNEWINMKPLVGSGDAAVEQEAAATAAATGNTGSGQGTSCWPLTFFWGSKKAKTK